MGIMVNFVLVEFFRPVNYHAKPPEHLCGTRNIVANSAQKSGEEKSKLTSSKNSTTDSKAFYYGVISILLGKLPDGNDLDLSNYKHPEQGPHNSWACQAKREKCVGPEDDLHFG